MKLDKRIELATVERASLHVGEGFPLKRIVAANLQVTETVARSTQSNDLTAAVIERTRNRDNPLRDLEERSHRISFAKQDLPLVPLSLATEGKQLREADVIQGPAQVHRSADAGFAWRLSRGLSLQFYWLCLGADGSHCTGSYTSTWHRDTT